ncbi:MAG: sigma-70 family RNA polymerase sigma factor [Oscillospiraceae bacterium]|nr:sigma-70 family RNA polymerase sigma factor [Oscillospiraceae bacterium]
MEDKEIIGLYFARSERAIEETAGKYGSFCHGIAYHILGSNEDSKECVNDTYYHVWNVIPPNRPSCFRAFLGKITRNLALGKYRARHAQKRGGGNVALALEELREAASCLPPDEALIEAELVQLIDAFLEDLNPQARLIFVRRYWYLDTVREIAAAFRVSVSAVKMSLLRSRNALKARLEKEGYRYDK